ncbi:hypothetical protein Droror1_Dr00002669 [Drosera rotundifolia]
MAAATFPLPLPLRRPFITPHSRPHPHPSLSTPRRHRHRLHASSSNDNNTTTLQLYRNMVRLLATTPSLSSTSSNWTQIEGAWVLKPPSASPAGIVHFLGGIFVGAAPQLTYRLFLQSLSRKANLLIVATPFSSGFDHFAIADEAQFKFDRTLRVLNESESKPVLDEVPVFGIGHSLGTVIHLLIGSRYAVRNAGNVMMAFNNREASEVIPLFSSVLVPMAQGLGPVIDRFGSLRGVRAGAEMTMKGLESMSPEIVKQVLPLVEQVSSLYVDVAKGREEFSPAPEETRRIVRSYYGITRNLLVKFEDDTLDETPRLAQILSVESAVSSSLDMSIRTLPGDHVLPLRQALPDVPPGVTDAVNRGGELLANLTAGTPWESVARDVGSTLGVESRILGNQNFLKDLDNLVDVICAWIASNNTGSKQLKP